MAHMIEIETRPNGSYAEFLAVGKMVPGLRGQQKFVRTGYPHKDSRLKIEREFEGKAGRASERIFWQIAVPDDYREVIALVRKGSAVQEAGFTVLFPTEKRD